jgi:hypothetical protein
MASTSPLKAIVERIIEQKKLQGVDIMKKPKKVKAPTIREVADEVEASEREFRPMRRKKLNS